MEWIGESGILGRVFYRYFVSGVYLVDRLKSKMYINEYYYCYFIKVCL